MTLRRLGAPLKFLVVGVLNTLIGLLAIYFCKWLLGFSDVLANISGYLIGLAVSFILNRGWTFEHSGAVLPALLRFIAIFVLAYLFNLATVLTAMNVFNVNAYMAHAIGIAPYTVIFYFGSRYFAFRHAGGGRG